MSRIGEFQNDVREKIRGELDRRNRFVNAVEVESQKMERRIGSTSNLSLDDLLLYVSISQHRI
ncbi:MAG: hypothetical protein ABJF04_15835 [Reichenbachiella sp.]|uniref:hypothetical protein n=1 Tax=Reichenbachiella sp. TaxID=2184521 RepID=UPI0032677A7C